MTRRNPFSTGYVAAKIRQNTARRNSGRTVVNVVANDYLADFPVQLPAASLSFFQNVGNKVAAAIPPDGFAYDGYRYSEYDEHVLDSASKLDFEQRLNQQFGLSSDSGDLDVVAYDWGTVNRDWEFDDGVAEQYRPLTLEISGKLAKALRDPSGQFQVTGLEVRDGDGTYRVVVRVYPVR